MCVLERQKLRLHVCTCVNTLVYSTCEADGLMTWSRSSAVQCLSASLLFICLPVSLSIAVSLAGFPLFVSHLTRQMPKFGKLARKDPAIYPTVSCLDDEGQHSLTHSVWTTALMFLNVIFSSRPLTIEGIHYYNWQCLLSISKGIH